MSSIFYKIIDGKLLTPLMLRLVPMRGHGIIKGIDDQSGSCSGQDQFREGSLLGREATRGRMLLNGLGRGFSGESGSQRRGGQADRCPIGGLLRPAISAYSPLIRFSLQGLINPLGIPPSRLRG